LVHNILDAYFIADIDGDFTKTLDGNLFVILVMAVDSQKVNRERLHLMIKNRSARQWLTTPSTDAPMDIIP
jgi:hypothetical protein